MRTDIAFGTSLALVALLGCGFPLPPTPPVAGNSPWAELESGLDLGLFPIDRTHSGRGSIHVVRIDPRQFELRLLNASADDGTRRSARQWSERAGLNVAINASMYQEDYSTSVSLMRSADHVNNAHLTRHRSLLVFDPVDAADPPVALVDLTCESFDDWKARYRSHVQSIRMVSCERENVWAPGERRWSTAAIGIDDAGRVLFVHVATPLTTHALIDRLLELPIELERLMYVEGGPQAQLFVDSRSMRLELVGQIEGVPQASPVAWPVPNVIGAVRRASPGTH